MDYSLEQIMKSCNYNEICQTFLGLAKDEAMLEKLKEILYTGKSSNHYFKSRFRCADGPKIEANRRVAMASLLIRNPETFAFFEQNHIKIFHGTNANALPNILKYGIHSHEALMNKGISVVTGEKWSRFGGTRNFISFTDVLDLAQNYSMLSSSDGKENLSFGAIIGVSEENLSDSKIVSIESDFSEIDVMEHLPLESINCICVPEDKVNFVKAMMGDAQIAVLGMRDLNTKAFYIDDFEPIIKIYPELYQTKLEESKRFSDYEMKEMAKSRSFTKMKEFVEKIQMALAKRGENTNGRSFK